MKSSRNKITPNEFINNKEVQACLASLQAKFGSDYSKLLVSDVLDEDGNQYVNLVQKGGGVLGVALVGYTYILEEAGIRFMRMAGTSAGAINTSMMVAIGKKDDPKVKAMPKSKTILQYLCDLDFFSLVDGHPFARWFIRNFITHKSFGAKLKTWLVGILATFAIFLVSDIVFLGLGHYYPWAGIAARVTFVLTGFNLLLIAVIGFYIQYMVSRLRNCGWGINPGDFFSNWVKDRMAENEVNTTSDLIAKAAAPIPGLRVRKPASQTTEGLKGDVTFITSELVTQNKIEFPAMWDLFRPTVDELHPWEFVRASMSIPVFFESHIIRNIPNVDPRIQKVWKERFGVDKTDPDDERIIPDIARFVDGGMLSNFPINLFYNPKVLEPRLPAFGIDLDDSDPKDDSDNDVLTWTIGGYIGRMFNTIRYYYDKDFLLKNAIFKKGIGVIELAKYNWLNFFLTDEDKLDMFVDGAKAATAFLLKFDWPAYQAARKAMQQDLDKKAEKLTVEHP